MQLHPMMAGKGSLIGYHSTFDYTSCALAGFCKSMITRLRGFEQNSESEDSNRAALCVRLLDRCCAQSTSSTVGPPPPAPGGASPPKPPPGIPPSGMPPPPPAA